MSSNWLTRFVSALAFIAALSVCAAAQQRPLLTEDVDIIKPGVIRIESGFEFLQNQTFPLSGLKGDLMKLADTRLSFGMAPNVEFQIEWVVQHFLSIDSRGPSAIPLKLGTNPNDTNDVGDARLWMKLKLRNESRISPSFGFRFGIELPNSNQAKGIGTNTTNFYGMVTAGKRFARNKLNLFGNIGLGILTTPASTFTENDVVVYGLAGIYELNDRVKLVGEINGYHSTRNRPPLGTEDFSEGRLGAQIHALGVNWYGAGVFGTSSRAPKTGIVFGVSYDWQAFSTIK